MKGWCTKKITTAQPGHNFDFCLFINVAMYNTVVMCNTIVPVSVMCNTIVHVSVMCNTIVHVSVMCNTIVHVATAYYTI